ncbi:MAG: hypothetical protein ACTHKJ_06950 [Candidatus Nitrosocosmicus sp.]
MIPIKNPSIPHKPKIKSKNTILFVCVEYAGRSQMAKAFFRKMLLTSMRRQVLELKLHMQLTLLL